MGIISDVFKKVQKTPEPVKSSAQNSAKTSSDSAKPATVDSGGNGSKQQEKSTEYVDKVLNSVFEEETENASNSIQKNANQSQEQIIQKLKDAGLKTTKIHTERGETDFAQYMAAISDECKKEIIDSYDCEADYILQQEILGMYKDKHSFRNLDFKSNIEKMGYKVDRRSVKTQYLTDWKKDTGSQLRTGHVFMWTISDPKTGAEIKIMDTNGNGEIEIEEVVANEFLTGISAQIDASNFKNMPVSTQTAGETAVATNMKESSMTETERAQTDKYIKNSRNEEGKLVLNERQYNILKEKIANYYVKSKGYDESVAKTKAMLYVQENCTISVDAKSINLDGLVAVAMK